MSGAIQPFSETSERNLYALTERSLDSDAGRRAITLSVGDEGSQSDDLSLDPAPVPVPVAATSIVTPSLPVSTPASTVLFSEFGPDLDFLNLIKALSRLQEKFNDFAYSLQNRKSTLIESRVFLQNIAQELAQLSGAPAFTWYHVDDSRFPRELVWQALYSATLTEEKWDTMIAQVNQLIIDRTTIAGYAGLSLNERRNSGGAISAYPLSFVGCCFSVSEVVIADLPESMTGKINEMRGDGFDPQHALVFAFYRKTGKDGDADRIPTDVFVYFKNDPFIFQQKQHAITLLMGLRKHFQDFNAVEIVENDVERQQGLTSEVRILQETIQKMGLAWAETVLERRNKGEKG